ncbi:MAG: hypothetical protein RR131_07455 [Anaerovorax sp.]
MSKLNISHILEIIFNNKLFRGELSIPQNLLNRDFKMEIMDRAGDYIDDYQVLFDSGSIFLQVALNVNQLGRINAKYKLTLDQFTCNNTGHKLCFTYYEDVKSQGNMMQSMALKAAGIKGSYLKTALEFSKAPFLSAVKATDSMLLIDLDCLEIAKEIPPSLSLAYTCCEDGFLKFRLF